MVAPGTDSARRRRVPLVGDRAAGRRLLLTASLLLVMLLPMVGHASQAADEYQVKAAFLLNFARFTEWPEAVDDNPGPLVLGIVGDDPFGSILDEIVASETVRGRPLEVRRLSATAVDAEACHVLFIASWTDHGLDQILERLNGSGVLTVGETEAFARRGGIIALVTEQARIRFVINIDAVDRSPLKLSSKLLTLARIVEQAPAERAAREP